MAANNLTNTKAELISSLVQKEIGNSALLTNFMENLSSMAMKGYNSISIPKLSGFTVTDRAFGAEGTDNAALTDSKDTINLDQNKLVKWNYDAADAMQSSIDYQTKAAERAASAHGRSLNSAIVALWDSVAGLDLASVADITVDNILVMRKNMLDNNADMAKVAMIVGTDQEKAILSLPEFSEYGSRGDGAAPVVSGVIGRIYGVPVYVNTAVADGQAYMVEQSGSAFAFQREAKYAEQPNLDYGTDGTKAVVDTTYGIGGLQIAEGTAAAGKSPFICKLA